MADKNYINNADFVVALTEYRTEYFKAIAEGRETPVVTDYIAKCFFDLAHNLANRFNFNRYTWKEDMCSEAHIVCLKSTHKFDPTFLVNGKPNAFGYFN